MRALRNVSGLLIEELVENVRDNIIRDFLAEYGHLLREYIWENYF